MRRQIAYPDVSKLRIIGRDAVLIEELSSQCDDNASYLDERVLKDAYPDYLERGSADCNFDQIAKNDTYYIVPCQTAARCSRTLTFTA